VNKSADLRHELHSQCESFLKKARMKIIRAHIRPASDIL
jgi:hypothetical protein